MVRVFVVFVLLVGSGLAQANAGYEKVVEIFHAVENYRQPLLTKKNLDYSPNAVEARHAQLRALRKQLDGIDPSAWSVSERVDYLLVRSQLDKLEFEFRVLRPWSRDPGLYVDLVREIPYVNLPVAGKKLEQLRAQLSDVPNILAHGKSNLTGAAGELAKLALRDLEKSDGVNHEQAFRAVPPAGVLGWYDDLEQQAKTKQADLLPLVVTAHNAVKDFHAWLQRNLPRMTAPAGIGAKEYDWYLQHVDLEPYNTEDVLKAGELEFARTMTALALERQRNQGLPPLVPAASAEEYEQRKRAADALVREFIAKKHFLTIPDYGKGQAFDNDVPWLVRDGGKRNFWEEIEYRDPLPDKIHAGLPGHSFDLFLHDHDTRPIRSKIEDGGRIEGWGFYLEEATMNAGLLDERPRTRELFWIFAIARSLRNKAEVMLQTNQWTVAQAVDFMVKNVPWMNEDVARVDCEIYLREPTYGQNYQMGKLQIEQLLAERELQLGDKFDLGHFHDEFLAAGTIPISLIRWEMTGKDDQVKQFWQAQAAHSTQ